MSNVPDSWESLITVTLEREGGDATHTHSQVGTPSCSLRGPACPFHTHNPPYMIAVCVFLGVCVTLMGLSCCLTSHTQSRLAAGTEFTTCQHAFTEREKRGITIRPLSLALFYSQIHSFCLPLTLFSCFDLNSLSLLLCLPPRRTDNQLPVYVCVCVCVGEAIQNVMTALAGPSVVKPSHLHPLSADEYVTLQTPALIVVQRANSATDLRSGLFFFM